MKISYITMQFPAPSETFASSDVKTLKSLGVDVDVYTLRAKHKDHDNMCRDRKIDEIEINTCGVSENINGFVYILKSPLLFLSLCFWLFKNDFDKPKHLIKMIALIPTNFYIFEKLKKEKPDIVHLFWGHYPSMIGYLVKKKMPNTKLSQFLGAYDLEYGLGVSRNLSKIADFIFTHAKVNLDQLEVLGVDTSKVSIVHRGTTVSKILPLIENIAKDKNTWLTVGRLLPSKGFDKVIDLFSKYIESNPNAKLNIVGNGIFKTDLEKQVKNLNLEESVQFLGHIDHMEVLKQMAKSNIFFLLSTKMGERLPNALKEAMLSKCICISSVTPGINELIENRKDGFVFEEKEYLNIVDTINNINIEAQEYIRNNTRKKIIDHFDVEVSMKKYLKIWEGKT